jgi:hypothetical protein
MSGSLLSPHDILAAAIAGLSQDELEDRKQDINQRLQEIQIVEPSKKRPRSPTNAPATTMAPIVVKTDTHWDFCMKEMMWLAADFQSERKRQLTMGKKLATGIHGYHQTKETRRVRELAEAELKRRRLAGKIGRELRGWWTKIERVIAYKQKLEADKERRQSMNQQLVDLVKQTERYGRSLTVVQGSDDSGLSIEEALAGGSTSRRVLRPTDYARVSLAEGDDEIYGESTEDSGSDGSFVLGSEPEEDDETTLLEALALETLERRSSRHQSSDDDDDKSYVPDPEEIQLLREEARMDVHLVLERMREEAANTPDEAETADLLTDDGTPSRRVTFAEDGTNLSPVMKSDPGNDADDDGDASDVEDFNDDSSDGSEEFVADLNVVDDETTIEAEERLGREMSVDDEISMLKREGELSMEELRKLYAAPSSEEKGDSDANDDENSGNEIVNDTNGTTSETNGDAGPNKSAESMFDDDDAGDQDEFHPGVVEVDDETTIDAEERLGREVSVEDEMNLLQKESEIPVEQLRAMYASMGNGDDDKEGDDNDDDVESNSDETEGDDNPDAMLDSGVNDDTADEEFQPDEQVDDETTMEAEERLGRDMSHEEELALLKRESEMSVDELRKAYQGMAGSNAIAESDEDDDLSPDENDDDDVDDGSEEFVGEENMVDDETTMEAEERMGREISVEDEINQLKRESEMPLEALRAMYGQVDGEIRQEGGTVEITTRTRSKRKHVERSSPTSTSTASEDDGLVALHRLKEMEDKLRDTLATRPFLLSSWVHMREYQQVGLNWLVSIQSRRLNGILADEMVSQVRMRVPPCRTKISHMSLRTHLIGVGKDFANDRSAGIPRGL